MGSTDPRRLINALGDLQEECSRWALEARESMAAAEIAQRQQEEVVRQCDRRARVVNHEAEDDRDQVQSAREDVDQLLDRCEDARHTSADLLQDTQKALQMAQRTLDHWEAELQKALHWLERALARLERAMEELEAAKEEYQDAQDALEDAIRALRRCQNDDKRRSCLAEQAAVAAAQERLQYAKVRLEMAIEEYQAAQEEVRQAQARVACCRQAVDYAQQGVELGRDAVSRAEAALAAAERSLDDARAAERMVEKAQENVESELYEAEQMVMAARRADRTAGEAERDRRKADAANQSAQRLLTGSRMELEYRVGQLRQLNQPSIGSVRRAAAVGSSGSSQSPLSRSRAKSSNAWNESSKEINQTIFRSYHPGQGQRRISAGDKYPGVTIYANGDVIGPHEQVRQFYSDGGFTSKGGQGAYMEAHHLLHEEVVKHYGLDPRKTPSVGLYIDEHRGGADSAGHPFGTRPRTHDLIVNAEDALDNYEEQGLKQWSRELKQYLKQNESHIKAKYESEDSDRVRRFFDRVYS